MVLMPRGAPQGCVDSWDPRPPLLLRCLSMLSLLAPGSHPCRLASPSPGRFLHLAHTGKHPSEVYQGCYNVHSNRDANVLPGISVGSI